MLDHVKLGAPQPLRTAHALGNAQNQHPRHTLGGAQPLYATLKLGAAGPQDVIRYNGKFKYDSKITYGKLNG